MDRELLKKLSCVYVEDEELILEQISMLLKRRLKDIHPASNGKEGVEAVAKFDPDIIITDLEMPVMNGIEMIAEIREKYGPEKLIIVITGYKDKEHYTEQADGYMYKPVDVSKLTEMIYNISKEHKLI